jgi:hypothetical protein
MMVIMAWMLKASKIYTSKSEVVFVLDEAGQTPIPATSGFASPTSVQSILMYYPRSSQDQETFMYRKGSGSDG